MEYSNFECGPQVGPRDAGESHPSATAEGSPSYSGGGKNCSVGQRVAGLRKHDIGFSTLDSDDASDIGNEEQAVEEGALDARSETHDHGDKKWQIERLKDLRVVLRRLSDTDFSDNMSTVPSTPTPPSHSPRNRPRRKRRGENPELDTDSDAIPGATPLSEGLHLAKRGRGKASSAGRYIGLAKARKLLDTAITREQQLDAEEEAERVADALKEAREDRQRLRGPNLPPVVDMEAQSVSALTKQAMDSLAAITDVARKSKNLKGGFVRVLKESAESLKSAIGELMTRTTSEEVARLQRANDRLSKELEELRQEIALVRQIPKQPQAPLPEDAVRRMLEENSRSSIEQFGTMLNARLEAIECRLLPAPTLRPRLAADRRRAEPLAVPVASQKSKKKGKKKTSMAAREAAAAASKSSSSAPTSTMPGTAASSALPPRGDTWSQVVRRSGNVKTPAQTKPKKKRRPRPPRCPRSAAVIMTLQPGAAESGVTYAKLIAEAMGKIDPRSIGIAGGDIRFRATQTEARMFQVYGAESSTKADSFAEKLREALSPDVVRISRPVKCCDIRLTGLDDSATAESTVEAVAREGDCSVGAIRAGSIGAGGSLWLSCPVAAAKKVALAGRVRVGWISARVTLLGPRPLRCYRCLEPGHVGALCKAGVDRSGLCYRCGESGHKARGCTAVAKCVVCVAAGRPAAHALGGKGCLTSRAKQAPIKGPRVPSVTAPPQEGMDVAQR